MKSNISEYWHDRTNKKSINKSIKCHWIYPHLTSTRHLLSYCVKFVWNQFYWMQHYFLTRNNYTSALCSWLSVNQYADLKLMSYIFKHFSLQTSVPWGGRVFSWGGLGVPHPAKILSIPLRHLSLLLDQACSPPPTEVRPRKFEKIRYIFVSNLTTFKLKSTLKSCISCLK